MVARPDVPRDRFCDLVMKGGITSGIVYPKAIEELALHYRFRNIGGTSAGAIAASITAAAEYQRERCNTMDGFDLLARIPAELAESTNKGDGTKLLSLFQPQRRTRRLFRVLQTALNRKTWRRRAAAVTAGLAIAYWQALLAVFAGAVLLMQLAGLTAAVLGFILFGAMTVGIMFFRDATSSLVHNRFGLCSGMPNDKTGDALTTWLHAKVQQAAGRSTDGDPLTFGDLWHPHADVSGSVPAEADAKHINLRMFTTCLTHGRPYILPLTDPTDRLFFKRDELADFMPATVLNWMVDHAQKSELASDLYELPPARDFPVLLAARLSLSFPILFSAVPLWAIYRPPEDNDGTRKPALKRCWFSDGGISSNFPMHLFDGLVPRWPTFGVQLEAEIPGSKQLVYLPQRYDEGYDETWLHLKYEREDGAAAARLSPASQIGAFLGSVVQTMQNWNDNCLARMPGVRDRVVRLRLRNNEGGMNLNMPPETVKKVSKRGRDAGQELIKRFLPTAHAPTACSDGWNEHRWVRMNVLLEMLEDRLPTLEPAMAPAHATSLRELISTAKELAPPGRERPLDQEEATALAHILDLLLSLGEAMTKFSARYKFDPKPRPELRIRPPL